MFKNLFGDCFFDEENMFWKREDPISHDAEDDLADLGNLAISDLLNAGRSSFGNQNRVPTTNFFGF